MLHIRKSDERGLANHGWLKSRHTFSFADYYDPKFLGFRTLRVINEDRIAAETGFGKHPHRDMEIISYVVTGALSHQDTMGNQTIIKPGEVQVLSAGTGMQHSEKNEKSDQETHFFQIWITPNKTGLPPSYGQKSFAAELNSKKLVLTLSENGRDGSLAIKQDADLYLSRLLKDDELEFTLRANRGVWVQVIDGKISVNGKNVSAGDGVAIDEAGVLKFQSLEKSEFMLFDLA